MVGNLFSDVANTVEFVQLAQRFASIEGWLGPADGYLLYRLARDGEGAGAIVEIGSWMGLSTAWLAAGSKAAGRETVHAVDVFDGGPMLKDQDIIRTEGTTYPNPLGPQSMTIGDLPSIINKVIKAVMGVIGSIALLMFIYGGFLWMTSAGNDTQVFFIGAYRPVAGT